MNHVLRSLLPICLLICLPGFLAHAQELESDNSPETRQRIYAELASDVEALDSSSQKQGLITFAR